MTRVTTIVLAAIAVLLAAPSPAAAKPAPPAEASVPDQPWYPPGYRDLRIAAEETVKTFPRDPRTVLWEDWDNPRKQTYDVIDCSLGYDLPETDDRQVDWQSRLALDIARMRSELRRLGYRPEIYDHPLLDHERGMLAQIADPKAFQAPDDPGVAAEGDAAGEETPVYYDEFWGKEALAAAMEANRRRLQPGKPRIIMEGGCGAGEVEFSVALSPPNGRLWLINAFAFKVCERKMADPWNHQACGWSEFASGETTTASGRYMYEARWPDGTVKRGAKVLEETEDGGAIVIRRN